MSQQSKPITAAGNLPTAAPPANATPSGDALKTEVELSGFFDLSLGEIVDACVEVVTAWPVAFLLFVWIWKSEIAALVSRATRFSGFGVDVAFEEQLAELEEQDVSPINGGAEGAKGDDSGPDGNPIPDAQRETFEESQRKRYAAMSPREAVLEAFSELERSAKVVAEMLGLPEHQLSAAVEELVRRGELPPESASYAKHLEKLRNSVSHDALSEELSSREASRYVQLTFRLRASLDQIWGKSRVEIGVAVVYRGGPLHGTVHVDEMAKIAAERLEPLGANEAVSRNASVGDEMQLSVDAVQGLNLGPQLPRNQEFRLRLKAGIDAKKLYAPAHYLCVSTEDGVVVMNYVRSPTDDPTWVEYPSE